MNRMVSDELRSAKKARGKALPLGIAALGAAALLASCAPHPTPFVPAMANRGYGYADQQLEQNRYRVTFNGNSDTPRTVVDNYLLYRAAQITKASGFDYFIIAQQETEPETRYRSTYDDFGSFGFHRHWGGGFGMTTSDTYPITRYQAYADIVMQKGRKPENEFRAFSADDVLSRLGPTVMTPVAPPPPR